MKLLTCCLVKGAAPPARDQDVVEPRLGNDGVLPMCAPTELSGCSGHFSDVACRDARHFMCQHVLMVNAFASDVGPDRTLLNPWHSGCTSERPSPE